MVTNEEGKEISGKILIKWDEVVKASIPVFKEFVARRVVPTLRTIHYALVSKNIIPNTKSAYKGLSSAFVKARQDGVIDWAWLADEGRDVESIYDGSWTQDPKEYANSSINGAVRNLRDALEGSTGFSFPKWLNQNYYVEVWIEKNALRATFNQYLEEFKVHIVPSRGYSSWTFLKEANDRIVRNSEGKTPLILYFGDFDPSGVDIERFLRESMNGFFNLDMKVKRIGVTLEQIEKYNLPTTPEDAEEIAKLHKDARFNAWTHGDYRVELDALLAFVPDEFEIIVKDSVSEYFDPEIYAEVQDKEYEAREQIKERMKEELPEKIKALLKELGIGDED
jgi:hypothetical protein